MYRGVTGPEVSGRRSRGSHGTSSALASSFALGFPRAGGAYRGIHVRRSPQRRRHVEAGGLQAPTRARIGPVHPRGRRRRGERAPTCGGLERRRCCAAPTPPRRGASRGRALHPGVPAPTKLEERVDCLWPGHNMLGLEGCAVDCLRRSTALACVRTGACTRAHALACVRGSTAAWGADTPAPLALARVAPARWRPCGRFLLKRPACVASLPPMQRRRPAQRHRQPSPLCLAWTRARAAGRLAATVAAAAAAAAAPLPPPQALISALALMAPAACAPARPRYGSIITAAPRGGCGAFEASTACRSASRGTARRGASR
jgi:hypothetical protein